MRYEQSCVCPSCNATRRDCTDDRDCDPGCGDWQGFFGTDHRGCCVGPLKVSKGWTDKLP